MTDRTVVVAGGGPTGMMLAGELALAGIDAVIVERRVGRALDGSRAGGLYARTIEVLDQRGIVDRFLAEGEAMQVQGFAYIPLDISDFPTRHNYGLALWQSHFERILAGWIDELGAPVLMGRDVIGFRQDDNGVDVDLTKREFDLLAVLAEHKTAVLSRAQLLELVWGYDFAADTNVVDVFIGYLRRKLEAGGAPRLLHTVRGMGYVLESRPPADGAARGPAA